MPEDYTLEIMKAACIGTFVEVRAEKNHSLWLRFADGVAGVVRLDPKEFTGVLEPLRDLEFFEKVFVQHGSASWPGEIGLAPDALFRELQKVGAGSVPVRSRPEHGQ